MPESGAAVTRAAQPDPETSRGGSRTGGVHASIDRVRTVSGRGGQSSGQHRTLSCSWLIDGVQPYANGQPDTDHAVHGCLFSTGLSIRKALCVFANRVAYGFHHGIREFAWAHVRRERISGGCDRVPRTISPHPRTAGRSSCIPIFRNLSFPRTEKGK